MTYLELLAQQIYSAAHPGCDLSDRDRLLYLIYAVLARVAGEDVVPEDVHDAWVAWALMQARSHPSIRPFDQLPIDVQQKDDHYAAIIRHVAQWNFRQSRRAQ